MRTGRTYMQSFTSCSRPSTNLMRDASFSVVMITFGAGISANWLLILRTSFFEKLWWSGKVSWCRL